MATPRSTAVRTVRSIVAGSPAWNPQATFALVTTSSNAASSPRLQRPYPSPRSEFRSTSAPFGLGRSQPARVLHDLALVRPFLVEVVPGRLRGQPDRDDGDQEAGEDVEGDWQGG